MEKLSKRLVNGHFDTRSETLSQATEEIINACNIESEDSSSDLDLEIVQEELNEKVSIMTYLF